MQEVYRTDPTRINVSEGRVMQILFTRSLSVPKYDVQMKKWGSDFSNDVLPGLISICRRQYAGGDARRK